MSENKIPPDEAPPPRLTVVHSRPTSSSKLPAVSQSLKFNEPSSSAQASEYRKAWARIRRCRSAFLLAWFVLSPLWVVCWFALGRSILGAWPQRLGFSLSTSVLGLFFLGQTLTRAVCPRCRNSFRGSGSVFMRKAVVPRLCASCGLIFGSMPLTDADCAR